MKLIFSFLSFVFIGVYSSHSSIQAQELVYPRDAELKVSQNPRFVLHFDSIDDVDSEALNSTLQLFRRDSANELTGFKILGRNSRTGEVIAVLDRTQNQNDSDEDGILDYLKIKPGGTVVDLSRPRETSEGRPAAQRPGLYPENEYTIVINQQNSDDESSIIFRTGELDSDDQATSLKKLEGFLENTIPYLQSLPEAETLEGGAVKSSGYIFVGPTAKSEGSATIRARVFEKVDGSQASDSTEEESNAETLALLADAFDQNLSLLSFGADIGQKAEFFWFQIDFVSGKYSITALD